MADDLERLVKLMEMTTSNYDMEALLAVRRANILREKLGKTWAELLTPAPLVTIAIGRTPMKDPEPVVDWDTTPFARR